jgi:hypothetical protein
MDVGETTVRHRYLRQLEVDVLIYLAPLAKHAQSDHEGDGLGHLGLAETGGNESMCSPHPGVVDGVQRLENCLSHLDGS